MYRKVLLLLLLLVLTAGFSTMGYGRNMAFAKNPGEDGLQQKVAVIEFLKPDELLNSTVDNKYKTLNKNLVISGRARQYTQVVFEVYAITTEVDEEGNQWEVEDKKASSTIEVNSLGIFAQEIEIFKGLNKIVIKATDVDKNYQRIERYIILSDINDIKSLPNRLIFGDITKPNNDQDITEKNEMKK